MKKILLLLSILLSIFGSINYSSAFFSNIFNSIEINSRAELLANDSLDSSCVNEAIDYYESSGDASYITIPLTTRLIMCPVIDVEVEILNLKDAYWENEDISFDVNVSKGEDKIVEIEFSCSYINVQHYSVHTMYYWNNEIDSERRYYGWDDSDNEFDAYAYTIEQSGLYNVDVSRDSSSSLDTQIPCRMYYVVSDADSWTRIDSIVETFTLVSESNEVNTQVSIVDLEDTYREGEEISFDVDVVKDDSHKVLIEMNCHYDSTN